MTIPPYLPTFLVLGGSLAAAFGVLLGDFDRVRAAKELAAKSDQLAVKSDEITSLNKKILSANRGGTSYCFLKVGPIEPESDTCPMTLVQRGEDTVYDVSIRIVDVTAQDVLRRNDEHYMFLDQPATKEIPGGNLSPGQTLHLDPLDLKWNHDLIGDEQGLKDLHDFDVAITARNGTVSEKLRFRREHAVWTVATRIEHNGEVEENLPSYMRDASGGFQW